MKHVQLFEQFVNKLLLEEKDQYDLFLEEPKIAELLKQVIKNYKGLAAYTNSQKNLSKLPLTDELPRYDSVYYLEDVTKYLERGWVDKIDSSISKITKRPDQIELEWSVNGRAYYDLQFDIKYKFDPTNYNNIHLLYFEIPRIKSDEWTHDEDPDHVYDFKITFNPRFYGNNFETITEYINKYISNGNYRGQEIEINYSTTKGSVRKRTDFDKPIYNPMVPAKTNLFSIIDAFFQNPKFIKLWNNYVESVHVLADAFKQFEEADLAKNRKK